jgi:ABC-type transport system substrate-binding protein
VLLTGALLLLLPAARPAAAAPEGTLTWAAHMAFGNAATRMENYIIAGGSYVYGSHPDMDGLFAEQVNETNARVRQQLLTKIQQMAHERAMFVPIMETAFLNGVGPSVEVDGLNVIPGFAYSAPYEDLKLKKK